MKRTVLVVGDAMLDRYLIGSAARISPEAPVPILRVEREEDRPGGAANVAANIAALSRDPDLRTELAAPFAEDDEGQALRSLTEAHGVNVFRGNSPHTIIKTRCIGPRGHQMLRFDRDEQTPPLATVWAERVDILVISDYAKGALPRPWELTRTARRTYCDGKKPPQCYSGAYVLKLNEAELLATGMPAAEIAERYLIEHVIVTREDRPIEWWQRGEAQARYWSVDPVVVADVSGAGDTFLAALVVADLEDKPLQHAIPFAAAAARVAVTKRGTAVVRRSEVAE